MAFEELKQAQSAVWSSAPFENMQEFLLDVHELVVERLEPAEGVRWLDVACGTGGLAELATRKGASVVGVDFAVTLVETARRRAGEQGLSIDYRVGDAERLELDDASFDVASSTFGVMFAPDQEAVAGELARVVRPGGRIGLASWTPAGSVGQMFRVLAEFNPPPPEGAGNPLEWGTEERVSELLGGAFDLHFEERVSTSDSESFDEFWGLFSTSFGPTKAMLERLPERAGDIREVYREYIAPYTAEDGTISHRREYLLVLGTRR